LDSGTVRGRLYRDGNLVWAIPNGRRESDLTFVFEGERLCWTYDHEYCSNVRTTK